MLKKSIIYIITKSVWGGAAKYVFDLSFSLKQEYTTIIAANGQGPLAQAAKKAEIPYFEIKNFQKNVNLLKDIRVFFEVFHLIWKIKPDVIHVSSSKAGGIVGLTVFFFNLLSSKKSKLIFTVHGWAFSEDRSTSQIFLIKILSRITCWFYDKIICVSNYDCQIALKNKIAPQEKLITIYNGIDLKNLFFLPKKKAQEKLIGRASPFLIGSIAEWTKNKGLVYLINALKMINPPTGGFDIALIGSGENPDKEKILEYQKYFSNLHLIEFLPEAAKYLKAFDIFVLPSLKEGLPYTIIEAMAAQIPIISTKVGGIAELISDNRNGLLVRSKNSHGLAAAINKLIKNPAMAQKISFQAKEKLKDFNIQKMIKKTVEIY